MLTTEPAPPTAINAAIPQDLAAVVMRCLSKERAHRFANVEQLATALVPFAGPDGERSLRRIRHAFGAITGSSHLDLAQAGMVPPTAVGGASGPLPPQGATVVSSPAFPPPDGLGQSTGESPRTVPFPQYPGPAVQAGPAGAPTADRLLVSGCGRVGGRFKRLTAWATPRAFV